MTAVGFSLPLLGERVGVRADVQPSNFGSLKRYGRNEYAAPTKLAILRHWFYKDSAPDGAEDDECDSRQRFHPRRLPQPQLERQDSYAHPLPLRLDSLLRIGWGEGGEAG